MQFRQGDLLFDEVAVIPSECKESISPTLAYGEVTGHSHVIEGTFTRFDYRSDIYVSPTTPCDVVHEEHGTVSLPVGKTFRVSRQRQYDPVEQIPKPVID